MADKKEAVMLKIRLKPRHASITIVEGRDPVRFSKGEVYEKDTEFLTRYAEWFELISA